VTHDQHRRAWVRDVIEALWPAKHETLTRSRGRGWCGIKRVSMATIGETHAQVKRRGGR
jgi:hypothetical protein